MYSIACIAAVSWASSSESAGEPHICFRGPFSMNRFMSG
uniref:Uncharacterized protein n=1 Tax=Arundo donax TaxID=35708 RepID=A0A0A8YLT8_ARUDO